MGSGKADQPVKVDWKPVAPLYRARTWTRPILSNGDLLLFGVIVRLDG